MKRAAILMLLLGCLTGCTQLFFHPMAQHVRTPTDLGLKYEDVWLTSEDGVKLHAWYLPSVGPAAGSVLFLHGNAQNISTHIGSVAWLPARNFNVLLLDYRGYGRSEGAPDVAGSLRDIDAALGHLIARPGIAPGSVSVFGQSLGGALSIVYVSRSHHKNAIRTLITDSAFSDFRGIAREKLQVVWYLRPFATPLSWTVTDEFRPYEAITTISPTPVLLIHGEKDVIVPATHAHRLFEAAKTPKDLWLVPDVNHIGALAIAEVRERFVRYLLDPRPTPP